MLNSIPCDAASTVRISSGAPSLWEVMQYFIQNNRTTRALPFY